MQSSHSVMSVALRAMECPLVTLGRVRASATWPEVLERTAVSLPLLSLKFVCSSPLGSVRFSSEQYTSRYPPPSITVPSGNTHLAEMEESSDSPHPARLTASSPRLRSSIQS